MPIYKPVIEMPHPWFTVAQSAIAKRFNRRTGSEIE
jgi:hypothetical protein